MASITLFIHLHILSYTFEIQISFLHNCGNLHIFYLDN